MPSDPNPGRERAHAYGGAYGHDTRGPGRTRRHRADEGPTLFDQVLTPAEPSLQPPPSHAYLTAPLRLKALLDWIEYAVIPEDPAGTGAARLWRLEAPGCVPWRVAELEDPEDPTGCCDPRYRGLWCSCANFTAHLDCRHIEDLAAAGLLRPDQSDWEDLDDAVCAELGGWGLNDRADLDAEEGGAN